LIAKYYSSVIVDNTTNLKIIIYYNSRINIKNKLIPKVNKKWKNSLLYTPNLSVSTR